MPTFYFDLDMNGALSKDMDGSDVPDLETAKHEAVRTLLSLARESEPELAPRALALRVRDQRDELVFETAMRLDVYDVSVTRSTGGDGGALRCK